MEHVLAKLDMKTVKLSGFQVISPADQSTKGLEVFFLQTFFAGNSQSESCGGENAFSHQVCNIIEICYTLFKITIKLSMQHWSKNLFRADWDSFFRENKEMNEMKAGERPDTVKLENMPCKWWAVDQNQSKS